jgi:hypothetical protein
VSTEAEVRFTPRIRVPKSEDLLPEYRTLREDELFASHLVYVSQKLRV